ncbi:TfoX/Sxy family protein [Robiginitomaculum antarcticum]|uniref:TfoX/Sxy family protein n=1 Tax=Robiginitomaculum antarcticum TaxID=437507 RepID=UPI00037DB67B|nr:TfoX/Sxy family protein [Robiginitomaculum antarcticum]
MPITPTEIEDAMAQFSMLGPIRTRKMMGGLTLYAHDVTFAFYAPDQGYFLKSDAQTHADFEAAGMARFIFVAKSGKSGTMNYFAMPDAAYDDPEICEHWARKSLDVALRAAAKKKKSP